MNKQTAKVHKDITQMNDKQYYLKDSSRQGYNSSLLEKTEQIKEKNLIQGKSLSESMNYYSFQPKFMSLSTQTEKQKAKGLNIRPDPLLNTPDLFKFQKAQNYSNQQIPAKIIPNDDEITPEEEEPTSQRADSSTKKKYNLLIHHQKEHKIGSKESSPDRFDSSIVQCKSILKAKILDGERIYINTQSGIKKDKSEVGDSPTVSFNRKRQLRVYNPLNKIKLRSAGNSPQKKFQNQQIYNEFDQNQDCSKEKDCSNDQKMNKPKTNKPIKNNIDGFMKLLMSMPDGK